MSSPTLRAPLYSANNSAMRTRPNENTPNRTNTVINTSTSQGHTRTSSTRSVRPMRKLPVRSSISAESDGDEEARAMNAQLITELREQLERAEQASEQYRKQLEMMQKRLDEAADEQTIAEEREYATRTRIDTLQAEVKDNIRQQREMEMNHNSERTLLLQDRERQIVKEAELQSIISRLTESIKMRSLERANDQRINSWSEHDEQPSVQRQNADEEHMQLLQVKDDLVESLKLELADAHIRLAEQEHVGDGQLQALEKNLRDIKMQNARLIEENDSFQMLLSEKTLKGDFLHDQQNETFPMTSLAEELETAGEGTEVSLEAYKKVEADLRASREEKKALTLYIDKIIGRLLQHEGFEHIITGKEDTDSIEMPPPPPKSVMVEKALPATPAQFDPGTGSSLVASGQTAGTMSFLQRARSVVARPAGPKPRPQSYMPAAPTANENPQTAPSIPISRGHRRARSDQTQSDMGAAAVVQQMNRGSPLRAVSGGPLSPGISPLNRAQNSYFGPAITPAATSASSQSGTVGQTSSRNSIVSDRSFERDATDAGSTQLSFQGRESGVIPAGVMKQNQLRPLRLVQEQTNADEEAQKRANRGSWMGWFKQGSVEAQNDA